MRKSFIALTFLLFSSLITLVHAEPFNLMELPTYIDTQLGVGTFIAGLLISLVILMLVLLPVLVVTKGKQFSLYMVLTLVTLAPLTALGWFNAWVFIVIILAIAVGLGQKITDLLGGLRK